jgi:hypothetical protein
VSPWQISTKTTRWLSSPSGWDREFESPFLQRGVGCEPGFVARTDLPLRRLIRINGLVCERDDLFNGLHIYDRGVLEKENQSNGPAGFAWRS